MNFCPHCGSAIQQGQLFCGNCGKSIANNMSSNATSPKLETPISPQISPSIKTKKSFPPVAVLGVLVVLVIAVLIISNSDDSQTSKEQVYQTQAFVKMALGTEFYKHVNLSKYKLIELSGNPSEIADISKNESSLRYLNVVNHISQVYHVKNGIVIESLLSFNLNPEKTTPITNELIIQLKSDGFSEVERSSKTKVLRSANCEISIYPPSPNEDGTLLILIIAAPLNIK